MLILPIETVLYQVLSVTLTPSASTLAQRQAQLAPWAQSAPKAAAVCTGCAPRTYARHLFCLVTLTYQVSLIVS